MNISIRPLVSIITVVFNNEKHIEGAIKSVISQNYQHIEHIVIDGASTDNTIKIIERFQDQVSIFISESDCGIYDALNKGIAHASGEIIAVLHSDDEYCNENVVSNVMSHMKDSKSEFCFSDMVIVDNSMTKVLRYYLSGYFSPWMLRMGWMPPHPTCFIKKSLFNEFGLYSLDYKISGDFDFLVRIFYGREVKWSYLNRVTIKMRRGGVSNSGWNSKVLIFNEINLSLKSNGVWSLPIFQLGRYFIRLLEALIKPKKGSCD